MDKPVGTTSPTFAEATRLWLKVGLISFGGPAAQISILHEELVERRGWIDERGFLTALNFCMLLPGPEAQQLATYMGLKLHGLRGALAAGVLFVLPGALVLFALAWLAAAQGAWPPLQAMFRGMLPIVVALIANAVWRIGSRTLKTPVAFALAIGAFVGLALLKIAFPWIIASALAIGFLADRAGWVIAPRAHAIEERSGPAHAAWPRIVRRFATYTLIFALLWAAPVGLALVVAGSRPLPTWRSFSLRPRSSRSAAPTRFSRSWPRAPSSTMRGFRARRWCMDWPWPRRRLGP